MYRSDMGVMLDELETQDLRVFGTIREALDAATDDGPTAADLQGEPVAGRRRPLCRGRGPPFDRKVQLQLHRLWNRGSRCGVDDTA